MNSKKLRSSIKQIYESALQSVEPELAVKRFLQRKNDMLKVGTEIYDLRKRRVFLIGMGKAGVPMARAVEKILGPSFESGIIVVKYGCGGKLEKTKVLEAGHPEPDQAGVESTQCIVNFLQKNVTSVDLLFVVISGGGSALLTAPVSEISLKEKRVTTRLLIRSGATIQEINAVRKHLSRVKGGKLLEYAKNTQTISLLLSDVVGDDLTSIASGPTSPDPTTFEKSLRILWKYKIENQTPRTVLQYLRSGLDIKSSTKETPKPGDPLFQKVQNIIVGNNIIALKAAAEKARALGFSPLILSSSIVGNTLETAQFHVSITKEILLSGHPITPPCCLISGGETTVQVIGDGKGGRNQEFVLHCAREISDWQHSPVLFASLGSDGEDGPTDVAGAIATPNTVRRANSQALSIDDFLKRNDSYHFFQKLRDQIITGSTKTNVMDLRFVLIGEDRSET